MKASIALCLSALVVSISGAPAELRREAVPEATDHALGFSKIEARQAGDTQNDITSGSACKALTVIFGRGTFETGNV